MAFYEWISIFSEWYLAGPLYFVPGSVEGCFAMDSLLFSTLACFYSTSDCLSIVLNFTYKSYSAVDTDVQWFNVNPLIYDQSSSRFPPNTLLSVIVRKMMIEQWNSSYSFDRYYNSCLPSHCIYSDIVHTKDAVGVIITLISMIASLTVGLRLIIPPIVTFIMSLFKPKLKKERGKIYV
jgi:hypothetical protein